MSNVRSIEAEADLIQAEVIRDERFDRAMVVIGRLCEEAEALRSAAREARSVEAWEDVQRRAASLSDIAGYFLQRAKMTRDAEWAVREAHNVWNLSDGMGER